MPTTVNQGDIRRRGVEVLLRELGPVDTARFLGQAGLGSGDWTKERQDALAGETVDSIVARIAEREKRSSADS